MEIKVFGRSVGGIDSIYCRGCKNYFTLPQVDERCCSHRPVFLFIVLPFIALTINLYIPYSSKCIDYLNFKFYTYNVTVEFLKR